MIAVQAVLAIAILALLAIQTGPGRAAIVALANRALAGADNSVELAGLSGFLPFGVGLERIVISDGDGPWLEIEDVDLDWSVTELIFGRLDVTHLGIGRAIVQRRPAPAEESGDPGGMPGIDIDVERITVGELVLGAPVAGVAATLSGTAGLLYADDGRDLAASLDFERVDGVGGRFLIDMDTRPERGIVARVEIAEPAGGVFANLVGAPQAPAISITLDGAGTANAFRADLGAKADGRDVLDGVVAFGNKAGERRLVAEIVGTLDPLLPPELADLFGGNLDLSADARLAADGALALDRLDIASRAVSASGRGRLGPGGEETLQITVDIGHGDGRPVRLPAGEMPAEIGRLQWSFAATPADSGTRLQSDLQVTGLAAGGAGGDLVAELVGTAPGGVLGSDPIGFKLGADIGALRTGDEALDRALGERVALRATGAVARSGAFAIETARLTAAAAEIEFAGRMDGGRFSGKAVARAGDLSGLSELAGFTVGGGATLSVNGDLAFDLSEVTLDVSGAGNGLSAGNPAVNGLVGGDLTLAGDIAGGRDDGIALNDIKIEGENLRAKVGGRFDRETLKLALDARIAELRRLNAETAGEALVTAKITGAVAEPDWTFTLALPEATLRGKTLSDGKIALSGRGRFLPQAAELNVSGTLGGEALSGRARLARRDDGGGAIDELAFSFAEARISGNLALSPEGRLAGPLDIAIPDLAALSPLALMDMSGRIAARLDFADRNGRQDLKANALIEKVAIGAAQIGRAEVNGTVSDLFGTLSADGKATADAINIGTVRIDDLAVTADHRGAVTAVDLRAAAPDGNVGAQADITPAGEGIEIGLKQLQADYRGIVARLQAPTRIRHAGGLTTIAETALGIGGGRFTLAGEAGDKLALDARFADIPAKLANTFSPKLGAEGSVSGTARIAGTPAAPVVDWTLALRNASLAESRGAGLPAISVDGAGRYAGDRLTLDAKIGGVDGLDLKVAGRAPVAAADTMDLTVAGRVPLSIARNFLRSRGTKVSGALRVDLALKGRPPVPAIAGTLGIEGGRLSDPQTGLSLSAIAANARFANGALDIGSLTGRTADGGNIAANGRVEINPDSGFPGDLRISARSLRYTDGKLVNALFDADLTLGGALAAAPNVGGTITLNRTEITIPEELPVNVSALSIDHKNAPDAVKKQHRALHGDDDGGARKGPAVRLDLTVRAPGRFFVRGRGLDAEMEGAVRVAGTPETPRVSGAFSMRRGRLSILGKRLDFTRGGVEFAGDLDPYLDFLATTETSDATVSVAVTGQASDPEFNFTSSPSLPQDEVLARLLFDRGIDKLSPLQIATLAAEVAKLGGVGGGSGPGVLDQVRRGLGVDDLDVGTDEAGNTTVKAGRYVTDRVYLGVKQGTTADSSKVTVDIDVTKNLKAKGEVGADGTSKLGVGVEWDY